MWVVVGCQIYLDIYDLLGYNDEHGVEALEDTLHKNKVIWDRLEVLFPKIVHI